LFTPPVWAVWVSALSRLSMNHSDLSPVHGLCLQEFVGAWLHIRSVVQYIRAWEAARSGSCLCEIVHRSRSGSPFGESTVLRVASQLQASSTTTMYYDSMFFGKHPLAHCVEGPGVWHPFRGVIDETQSGIPSGVAKLHRRNGHDRSRSGFDM
jgi:hypothetical protein